MTKVVAIMSTSRDGYVADNDGVDEVFDWYFSGDVEISMPSASSDMTFRVSAPSADHLRGLMAEIGAMLTGRRTFDRAGGWGGAPKRSNSASTPGCSTRSTSIWLPC